MSNVYNHLEALWALEKVSASTLLSLEEKQVIAKDIYDSLPPPQLVAYGNSTYNIVLAKLSIQPDEKIIDSQNNRPNSETTPVPRGSDTIKKEDRKAKR